MAWIVRLIQCFTLVVGCKTDITHICDFVFDGQIMSYSFTNAAERAGGVEVGDFVKLIPRPKQVGQL